MEKVDLNEIPDLLESGRKSSTELLNYLAAFVLKNKALFDLYKYDDDFTSEVILTLLERGQKLFISYDKELGNFFNYFYYYVKNLIRSTVRTFARKQIIEGHGVQESIYNLNFKKDAYEKINFNDFDKPVIPYAYKKPDAHNFLIACKTNKYRIKKYNHDDDHNKFMTVFNNSKKFTPLMIQRILIVLGLKSAYYISDEQIEFICDFCNLDKIKFYDAIQYIKNFLYQREENKMNYEYRRNNAYFHHKKYDFMLQENLNQEINKYEQEDIMLKFYNQTKNWNKINDQLKNGLINIRPTSKFIAEILQISQRQVNYYLQNAKLLGIELEE